MFEIIKVDLKRKLTFFNTNAHPGRKSYQHAENPFWNSLRVLLEPGTLAVILFRFGKWALKFRSPWIRRPLLCIHFVINIFFMFIGIHIQLESEIGKGFMIHNYSGIFVLAERIGENFTVNQGVVIGRLRGRPHDAIIGDNVYFASGAMAFGDVKIGNNVAVGANSLVAMSVPDNCTVLGVPARIIMRKATSPYLKLVLPEDKDKSANA